MTKLDANLVEALFDLNTTIRRAVFFTYRFDPGFFADSIYPNLYRQRCERTLVLMDSAQYYNLPKSELSAHFGRLVMEHFPGIALFHPKLFIVTGGGKYRCVIGSANLTQDGFENNREIFSVFSEQNGDTAGLIRILSLVKARLHPGALATRVLHETIAELKVAEQGQVDSPSTPIVWNGLGGPSLFEQIENETQGQKLKKAVILSPYFEAPDHFDSGLLDQWLAKGIQVDLYVPFDQSHNRVPKDEIAKLYKKYPKTLRLFGVRTGGKILHAKLIGLMSSSHAWLLAGSANFTNAALKGNNVESSLLFRMTRRDAEAYLDQLLIDARSIETNELGAPDKNGIQKPTTPITGFMISAVLSLTQDCVTILLDRPLSQVCPRENLIIELGAKRVSLNLIKESDHSIQIEQAGSLLKNTNGIWTTDIIIVKDTDGAAYDWRQIELSPDESITEDGIKVEEAIDLETFIARLLNPRLTSHQVLSKGFDKPEHKSIAERNDFDDVEGRLDRSYRWSCALEAHFAHLMTDPHTTHRWRRDWLHFSKLFTASAEDLGSEGKALIAVRLLSLVETCYTKYPNDLQQWLNSDPVMFASIEALFHLAHSAPTFSAPTITTLMAKGDK